MPGYTPNHRLYLQFYTHLHDGVSGLQQNFHQFLAFGWADSSAATFFGVIYFTDRVVIQMITVKNSMIRLLTQGPSHIAEQCALFAPKCV